MNVPTIPAPKSSAFLTAALRSPPPCFAKYEAVMGTMGKTHGVRSANAPAEMASQKKALSITGAWARLSGQARLSGRA